ncbi:hypothetical protein [Peribacillus glennii]|uniref:Uncharacterized protein n=1 Tax=Peribacillus glennii TaxID=2303991 RepID=A0A372LFZ8_9BACI|nr:hypothetical protein [Peribacillus glennii]RFU65221.1 hypothetical protein D0466_04770 [Peribacillus glennii]
MEICSFSFSGRPVYHVLPGIYEGLGLPELSSYIEQHFDFTYTLGKSESTGHGRIRFYKSSGQVKVDLPENLPGVGPVRLQKLKELLLEKAKNPFMGNAESAAEERKVYHAHFRRRK